MTSASFQSDLSGTPRTALERNARARRQQALRWGSTWTTFLMVLPGLLSSNPVGDAVTGGVVGFSATSLTAVGVHVWCSYVGPYRRVRALIREDLSVHPSPRTTPPARSRHGAGDRAASPSPLAASR